MPPTLPIGVRVPGSSANLGPGFDTFAVALQIYLEARMFAADGPAPLVRCTGANSEGIPLDGSNLVLLAFRRAFESAGREAPKVRLELRNDIPLARGLGSSGAAIVAGLELADRCGELGLGTEEKLALAAELEQGHPDNVSASLLGGFTIACAIEAPGTGSSRMAVRAVSLPWPPEIELVVAIPAIRLATEDARAALPATYARADVVFNLQRAALLAATLAGPGARREVRGARDEVRGAGGEVPGAGDEWPGAEEPRVKSVGATRHGRQAASEELAGLVSLALADRLHQPYRAPLVPGLAEALELSLPGLLGVALSGAGPSIVAFISGNRANVVNALRDIYTRLGIGCEVRPIGAAAELSHLAI